MTFPVWERMISGNTIFSPTGEPGNVWKKAVITNDDSVANTCDYLIVNRPESSMAGHVFEVLLNEMKLGYEKKAVNNVAIITDFSSSKQAGEKLYCRERVAVKLAESTQSGRLSQSGNGMDTGPKWRRFCESVAVWSREEVSAPLFFIGQISGV
jgi:hypothetical protein